MGNHKVLIRVDGNSQIGLGHIYRGIALAEMLKEDFEIVFISVGISNVEPIKSSGFIVDIIPEFISLLEEPVWFAENYNQNDILVVDGYQFTSVYQLNIIEQKFKLFYIDDLVKGMQVADVVINHCPGTKENDYLSAENTKLALGLDYALLRDSFTSYDRSNSRKISSIKNILISFGASNPGGFSDKAIQELVLIDSIEEIHVLGEYNLDALHFSEQELLKINVHSALSEKEVFNVMKPIDLAIVPSSTVSLELAALGIPMIIGYFIDNQKRIYEGFKGVNSVFGIENYYSFDFSTLNSIIEELNNLNFLNTNNLTSLFKGNPKENIKSLFKEELISVRRAVSSDLMFAFNLANESLVRANSYNSKKIDIEGHTKWFENQLQDENTDFYIIEFKKDPIGQVRFNLEEDHAVIGISLIEQSRGMRLSPGALRKSVHKFVSNKKIPVFAYIKKTNKPSIKSFERAGFTIVKEVVINDSESYLLKYT